MIKSSIVLVDGAKRCQVEMEGMSSEILVEFGVLTQHIFKQFKDDPNLIVSLVAKAAANANISLEDLL